MRKVCEPNITPSGAGNAVPEQTREGLATSQPFAFDAYWTMRTGEFARDLALMLWEMKKSKGKSKGGGKKRC